MKIRKTENRKLKIAIIILILMAVNSIVSAAITSVVCVPASPTVMSTGLGYYLAGKTYDFDVTVVDPAAVAWTDISAVRIVQAGGFDIQIAPDGINGTTFTVNSGSVTGTCDYTGTFNSFTVTFHVLFHWTSPDLIWAVAGVTRRFTATATPATGSSTHVVNMAYGISTEVDVTNFNMTGEASDLRINPWHQAFTVDANQVVYDIPGANDTDAVRLFADLGANEIINCTLFIDGGTTGLTDATENGLSFSVPSASVALGSHVYRVQVEAESDGTVTAATVMTLTPNMPTFYCDRIRVTVVTFINGGGVDSAPTNYYRSVNVPGTQVTVTAVLDNNYEGAAGAVMVGNTTIQLRDSLANDTDILIANGTTSATMNLTYPAQGAGSTTQRTYQVVNIIGGSYGSAAGFGQNNDLAARITQPASRAIYWENADPPGNNASQFTTAVPAIAPLGATASAQDIRFEWGALASPPDGDFGTTGGYKIYYKDSLSSVWSMIDRTTAGFAALGNVTQTNITVTGLVPMTSYDYRISAVDVFGNEVSVANMITGTISTAPTTISCEITDGISTLKDSDFSGDPNPNPNLLLTALSIKVKFFLATTGNPPDTVSIVIADNASDVAGDWGSGAADDITALVEGVTKWTIPCVKVGPNTYAAFIPSAHPLMNLNSTVRLILKTTYGAGVNYVDANMSVVSYTDDEWRFYIGTPPDIKKLPLTVLNNVITKKNPKAYPAYFLTDSARVTMKVYDIKGRVVRILLDDALRPGGKNIRENGWDGKNKSGKMCGTGLYYIHVFAKRASDGKIVLNKFEKVVISE